MRILIVCAANQCRSRTAHVLLDHLLADVSGLAIRSAGVQVEAPLPMCSTAIAYVTKLGFDPGAAAHAAALQLSAGMVADADLLLVADATVRAAVHEIDPTARAKTFSLRDAGAAAQYMTQHELVTRARAAYQDGQAAVTELVDDEPVLVCTALAPGEAQTLAWLRAELEAAKGHAMPKGGRDVPDAHVSFRILHSSSLRKVHEATRQIAPLLRALVATNGM